MNTMRDAAAVACAVALLLGAGAAQADEPADAPTKRVSLAGLDPSTRGDVAVLYARLRHAAKAVCAHPSAPATYSPACAEQALDAAVRTVGWPLLAQLRGDVRTIAQTSRTIR